MSIYEFQDAKYIIFPIKGSEYFLISLCLSLSPGDQIELSVESASVMAGCVAHVSAVERSPGARDPQGRVCIVCSGS